MDFVWTIRNKLSTTLFIRDINKPYGIKIGPYRTIQLHKFFTLDTLLASNGLSEALAQKYAEDIEKIMPKNGDSPDMSELQRQIAELTMAVGALAQNSQNQAPVMPVVDDAAISLLREVSNKIDTLHLNNGNGSAEKKTNSLEGFNDLSPEMVALKAREKMVKETVSNFDFLGVKQEQNISQKDAQTLEEIQGINLDDIDLEAV